MLVAKLSISYDRGLCRNKPEDVVDAPTDGEAQFRGARLVIAGQTNHEGKVIRGLGTHFRSKEDFDLARERDAEANKIRKVFKDRFLVSPIPGVYFMPKRGAGQAFVDGLGIRSDMEVRVSEYNLSSASDMEAREVAEWVGRIKKQFAGISLGRKKEEIDGKGLDSILELAGCPVLSQKTADQIKELVGMLKAEKITKVDLKRRFKTLEIEVGPEMMSPRVVR